ncbi:hypothetical protein JMJ77_0014740, partial [Colletotrichum scovillei]
PRSEWNGTRKHRPSAVRAGRVNHWLPCRAVSATRLRKLHLCTITALCVMVCSLCFIHFHSHARTLLTSSPGPSVSVSPLNPNYSSLVIVVYDP